MCCLKGKKGRGNTQPVQPRERYTQGTSIVLIFKYLWTSPGLMQH